MDRCDMYYYRNRAIKAQNGSRGAFSRRQRPWRSESRQWDCIVRVVCLGCGNTLGRYERINRLAFCFNCRDVLFPETIGSNYISGSRVLAPHQSWKGHTL